MDGDGSNSFRGAPLGCCASLRVEMRSLWTKVWLFGTNHSRSNMDHEDENNLTGDLP